MNLMMLSNMVWIAIIRNYRGGIGFEANISFRREISSDFSKLYPNSQNLRKDLVPVALMKAFSLQFQITEFLN